MLSATGAGVWFTFGRLFKKNKQADPPYIKTKQGLFTCYFSLNTALIRTYAWRRGHAQRQFGDVALMSL